MIIHAPSVTKRIALTTCTFLLLAFATKVFGWESDVHYGLTRWLAIKAGFSPRAAEAIAAGDWDWDKGFLGPAPTDSVHIIAFGSEPASRTVRLHHFPTDGPIPGSPEERKVEPKSPAASKPAVDAINTLWNNVDIERERSLLKDFGGSLHPFQDSWSHQGIPDSPFRPFWTPRRNLTWGHPAARGGWWSHDADLTPLHPEDTLEMAKETYKLLCEFLDKHEQNANLRVRTAVPWESLEPQIRAFAQADTKQRKLEWFQNDSEAPFAEYGDKDFLANISLSGDWPEIELSSEFRSNPLQFVSYPPRFPGLGEPTTTTFPTTSDLSVDLTAERFVSNWIGLQDIEAAMQMVNVREIARQLQLLGAQNTDPDEWARKFLTSWLLKDHGLVNSKGHGFPLDPRLKGLPLLPEKRGEFELIPLQRIDEIIGVPRDLGGDKPYWLGRMRTSWFPFFRPHGMFFYFRRLPHDGVLILFKKNHRTWQVSRMLWIVQ